MKRLLPLFAVGALSLTATACDLSPPAVTVNGISVSRAQLDDQLSTVAGSVAARCALSALAEQNGTTVPSVEGSGDGTVSSQFAAFELTGLVRQTLEQHALALRHTTLSSADLASARQDYEAEISEATTQGSPCSLSGTTLVSRLPGAFLDQQARFLAYDEKVEQVYGHVDVSTAALLRYYQANESIFTEECLNLVVANDQTSAQTIYQQVTSGTSFAAAAQGPGADPNGPSGGQEPCVFPATVQSQLGQSVATVIAGLPAGGVAPPQGVSSSNPVTGEPSTVWIVVGVRQRQLATFADVENGLRFQMLQAGQTALNTALVRLAAKVDVRLDPQYGTWDVRAGVTPPTPPPASFVLNPAIDRTATSAPGSSPTG